MDWQHFLIKANDVLTAGVGATAFGLVLYLLIYNRHSRVTRSFNGLLGCVIVVYLVDILLADTTSATRAETLLRWQWLGIAFTPAFYVEFVRAIRQSVLNEHFPRWIRPAGFVGGAVIFLLAMVSDLLVDGATTTAGAVHLLPGPLFTPFALLFVAVTLWGFHTTLTARRRCFTHAARRRMAYLSASFIAPALGVFPYLLLIGWPHTLPKASLWLLLILGNVAVATMLVVMAYSIAFIGALTPDRVIKHRLVRFLLRGPATALLATIAYGLGATLESHMGLNSYTFSMVILAITIILAQLGIELAKPLIDLALYREGRDEVERVQALSQRMLTYADLQQFLENILAAICELLHSEGGFFAILENDRRHWEIWGDMRIAPEEFSTLPLDRVTDLHRQDHFLHWDGYWVTPLYDRSGSQLLGVVGVRAPREPLTLTDEQNQVLDQLLLQAGTALADRLLQRALFSTFTPLMQELQDIQRRSKLLRYEGEATVGFTLAESPELPQWVRSALTHYWGGPRLTDNPLRDLEVVKQAAAEYDGNTIKGLRAVLTAAIEQLKPDGERKLTAPEWLLYNILELKFLRGRKVREVAMRLAVSESDFYRKQRVAIQNLARIIAEMEKKAQEGIDSHHHKG